MTSVRLGGDYALGGAINENGQITGGSSTAGGQFHAFLYSNGSMIDLGTLGGHSGLVGSVGTAINDKGEITGFSYPAIHNNEPHAFLYTNGQMKDLGGPSSYGQDINSAGQIVGTNGSRAFIYSDGVMTDLQGLMPGEVLRSDGWTINDNGQIAVVGVLSEDNRLVAGITDFRFHDLRHTAASYLAQNGATLLQQVLGHRTRAMTARYAHGYVFTPIPLLFSRMLDDATGIGPGTSLADTVALSQTYYEANDGEATCGALGAFIQKVRAQHGKKIPANQAEDLVEDAITIKEALGCQ